MNPSDSDEKEGQPVDDPKEVDDRLSRSEQGLMEEQPPSRASTRGSAQEGDDEIDDRFEDCQTVPLIETKQAVLSDGSGRVLMSGRLVTLDDVAQQVQDLRDQVSTELKEMDEKIDEMKQDIEAEPLLPEDSYSFIAITRQETSCRYPGWSFITGLGVFIFQLLTLALLAIDVVDRENTRNRLGIPEGIEPQVRIAQLIALIITVISQDEVRLSLNLLYQGYDQGTVAYAFQRESDQEEFDEASCLPEKAPGCLSCCRPFFTMMGFRWYFSLLLRLLAGILGLAVTFMLLITVDSVRELLLNFTAVEFISNVDDAVFLLSKWGYFGDPMKNDADTVADAKWAIPAENNQTTELNRGITGDDAKPLVAKENVVAEDKKVNCIKSEPNEIKYRRLPIHTTCIVAIFLGMFTAWLVLSLRQQNGDFLTRTVYVQFGDEFSPALGTFSGLYEAEPRQKKFYGPLPGGLSSLFSSQRVDYVLTKDKSARFRYCEGDRVWAFLYGDRKGTSFDNCNDPQWIRAVSSETSTFDLSRTADNRWSYRVPTTSRDVPLQHFSLSKSPKVFGTTCDNKYEDKDDGFICRDGKWACKGDLFGEMCQFSRSPCAVLEVNEQYLPFADARSWSSKYDIAKDNITIAKAYSRSIFVGNDNTTVALAYGRPIYIGNETEDGVYDVMFFAGRRWVLTRTDLIDELNKKRGELVEKNEKFSLTHVANFLAGNFHAHWADFEVVFISEPVDVDTPTDVPTPVGLNWFRSKALQKGSSVTPLQAPDLNQDETAVFLCSICNEEDNPCLFGKCVGDKHSPRKCKCEGGTYGTLCQILPLGDGTCNPDFNTAGHNWDDGDCCPFTCESEDYSCGANETVVFGLQSREYVGFPNCTDPRQTLCEGERDCWKVWAELGEFENDAETGSFVALSGNGQVIAFREPSATEQVQVFVNAGKDWRPRGAPLRIASDLSKSRMLAVIESIPIVEVQSVVALSRYGSIIAIVIENTAQAYFWKADDNEWSPLGRNFPGTNSVVLSSDGLVLAAHSEEDDAVRVYNYDIGQDWRQLGEDIILKNGTSRTKPLSLSGDGNTLAVGHASNGTISVFKYSDHENVWTAFGPTHEIGIEDFNFDWAVPSEPLVYYYPVALSANGLVLAVGRINNIGEGFIVVFTYNNADDSWAVKGDVIMRNGNYLTLSLSSDGATVAVGSAFKVTGVKLQQYDHVRLYAFDNERLTWHLAAEFNDGLGTSVALSYNADAVAYDSPRSTLNGAGRVRVMWRKLIANNDSPLTASSLIDDSIHFVNITVEIQLDNAPWETGLSLECDGVSYGRISTGTLTSQGIKGVGIVQVPQGAKCTFDIFDLAGNGICCNNGPRGYFRVYYGETTNRTNLLAEGGKLFGSREQITFQVDDRANLGLVPVSVKIVIYNLADTVALNLTCGDILKLSASPGAFEWSSDVRVANVLLPKGTDCEFEMRNTEYGSGRFEIFAENGTNLLFEGNMNDQQRFIVPGCGCACQPKVEFPLPLECGSDEKLLRLELATNEYGAYVTWKASLESDDQEIDQKSLADLCSTYVFQRCISKEECVNYEISNTPDFYRRDINYTLFFDSNTVASDTRFQGYESSSVGDACPAKASPIVYEDCNDGKTPLRVEITLNWYPPGTSWEVRDIFQNILLQSEVYSYPEQYAATVVRHMCVPEGSCFLFDIHDWDGLCCSNGMGGYNVSYGPYQISGGKFENSEQRLIGDCDGATAAPTSAPMYTPQPTGVPSWPCPSGSISVVVLQTTRRNPDGTFWEVLVNGASVIASEPNQWYEPVGTCLQEDDCMEFFVVGEGSYTLFYDNMVVKEGDGVFGPDERFSINCVARVPTMAPSVPPWHPNAPWNYQSSTECGDGSVLLRFELLTDQQPSETTFRVMDSYEYALYLERGPFDETTDKGTYFQAETCVPDDECLVFEINDDFGDGICCDRGHGYYKVFLDNEQVFEGGEFEYGEVGLFGNCGFIEPPTTEPLMMEPPFPSILPSQTVVPSSTESLPPFLETAAPSSRGPTPS